MKWLILRGLVREQRHWGDFKSVFQAALIELDPGAQVFALDAPGFGTEQARNSPTNIDAIVGDFRLRFQKLSIEQPGEWNVLAISLGGMIALHWCAHHPGDFKRVVLINSSLSELSPFYHRMLPHNFGPVLTLLAAVDIAKRERKILAMTSNLKGLLLDERAASHASFALPVRKRDAVAQLLAAVRFRMPARVHTPMLVLGSKGDRLVHPDCSFRIAKFYQARFHQHPNANHDLSTDDPQWVANQVKDWIRS